MYEGRLNMKLIIDVPDKTYHNIIDGFYDYGDMNVIIQNGTPLEEELHREKEQAYYFGYEDGRKSIKAESEDHPDGVI
jgi:carbohydrate-binding DOMON domain-containing protein